MWLKEQVKQQQQQQQYDQPQQQMQQLAVLLQRLQQQHFLILHSKVYTQHHPSFPGDLTAAQSARQNYHCFWNKYRIIGLRQSTRFVFHSGVLPNRSVTLL